MLDEAPGPSRKRTRDSPPVGQSGMERVANPEDTGTSATPSCKGKVSGDTPTSSSRATNTDSHTVMRSRTGLRENLSTSIASERPRHARKCKLPVVYSLGLEDLSGDDETTSYTYGQVMRSEDAELWHEAIHFFIPRSEMLGVCPIPTEGNSAAQCTFHMQEEAQVG